MLSWQPWDVQPRPEVVSLIEPDRCSCLTVPLQTGIRLSLPVLSARHLDTEVRRILDEQKHNATDVLTTHRDTLENLAKALFEDETVQGEQLQRILALPDKPIRKRVTTRSANTRAAASAGTAPSRNSR